MNKKLFLISLLVAVIFAVQSASAYHSEGYRNSDWNNYNQYLEDRMVHNRMSDYFKYGSYWQGDVVYDLTYSSPPGYFPRYTAKPMMNYRQDYRNSGYRDRNYNYRDSDYRDYRDNYDYAGDYNSGYYSGCH